MSTILIFARMWKARGIEHRATARAAAWWIPRALACGWHVADLKVVS